MKRVLSLMLMILGFGGALASDGLSIALADGPHAALLEIADAIQPIPARFLARGIDAATDDGARLLIVRLDTPGGLLDSTRDMVESILASEIPVVVYVSPSGAEATSAGTFVAAAAHVAAMAPTTSIGGASQANDDGERARDTHASKETQVAAAFMRSIANKRGRNAEALENTVLRGTTYTASEALEANIIDLVAKDTDALLSELDGRTVQLPGGDVVLQTSGLQVREIGRTPLEQFLGFLATPNVAFLLLTIGGLGIFLEFLSPGLLVPGVSGAIALALAFVALGNLPVNWVGVALLAFAMALLFFEMHAPGFGVFGVGSLVSFLLGAFLLFGGFSPPPIETPSFRVSIWLIAGVAAVMFGFLLYIIRDVLAAQKAGAGATSLTTVSALVGQTATTSTELAPQGVVFVAGEHWGAVSDSREVVPESSEVEIVSAEGLYVRVSPKVEEPPKEGTSHPASPRETDVSPIAAKVEPLKADATIEYPDGLTRREVEVLRVVARGKSNSEIGEELFISINTVTRHLTNVYSKTGMSNRAEAAVYAARHNLL